MYELLTSQWISLKRYLAPALGIYRINFCFDAGWLISDWASSWRLLFFALHTCQTATTTQLWPLVYIVFAFHRLSTPLKAQYREDIPPWTMPSMSLKLKARSMEGSVGCPELLGDEPHPARLDGAENQPGQEEAQSIEVGM